MDIETSEQKPPSKRGLQKVLIAIIILLSVFIISSLILIFALRAQTSSQPRSMVLEHPDGEAVPAASVSADLEKAILLTKEAGAEMLKNDQETARQKMDELGNLMLSGRLIELSGETDCLLLEVNHTICKVQPTEGPQNGKILWVPRPCVKRDRANIDGNIPVGVCCGAVYLRYFISAAICCAGIYFLRLKSVFLQLTIFVLGMIIVNLLWIRLEMLLFL